jgi:hypothetical protein
VVRAFETVDAAPEAAVSFFKVYTNPGGKFTGLAISRSLQAQRTALSLPAVVNLSLLLLRNPTRTPAMACLTSRIMKVLPYPNNI